MKRIIGMVICLHNTSNDSNSSCSNISDIIAEKCGEELSREDWEGILNYRWVANGQLLTSNLI